MVQDIKAMNDNPMTATEVRASQIEFAARMKAEYGDKWESAQKEVIDPILAIIAGR